MAKRVMDLWIVAVTAPIWLPMLLMVGVLVWARVGWPVFYCQRRPGYQGRIFPLLKFRSMMDLRDASGKLLPDAQRLTSFGRWLRASSLDELPELLNVIRGEMSLVGPRPLLIQYLNRYSPEQARRHEVRPGLTGWAQIHGRNALSWDDKFKLDVWYVDNGSLWLDLRILLCTLKKVWTGKGISAAGEATMPEFQGAPRSQPETQGPERITVAKPG